MEFMEVLHKRRSVRAYTAEPVLESGLAWLIEAAVQAPSALNEQPWHFTVICDKTLLDEISRKSKANLLLALSGRPDSHDLRKMLVDPDFHIFYHAPALILISAASPNDWAVENCALAAENLMLAACSVGLGSCWIGFAQHWIATAEGRAAIGLPPGPVPVAPIIVGHPAAPVPPVARHAPRIRWIG